MDITKEQIEKAFERAKFVKATEVSFLVTGKGLQLKLSRIYEGITYSSYYLWNSTYWYKNVGEDYHS